VSLPTFAISSFRMRSNVSGSAERTLAAASSTSASYATCNASCAEAGSGSVLTADSTVVTASIARDTSRTASSRW